MILFHPPKPSALSTFSAVSTPSTSSQIFRNLPQSSAIVRNLPQCSAIFPIRNLPQSPASSAFFRNLPQPSAIFAILFRYSTIFRDLPQSCAAFRSILVSSLCFPGILTPSDFSEFSRHSGFLRSLLDRAPPVFHGLQGGSRRGRRGPDFQKSRVF